MQFSVVFRFLTTRICCCLVQVVFFQVCEGPHELVYFLMSQEQLCRINIQLVVMGQRFTICSADLHVSEPNC